MCLPHGQHVRTLNILSCSGRVFSYFFLSIFLFSRNFHQRNQRTKSLYGGNLSFLMTHVLWRHCQTIIVQMNTWPQQQRGKICPFVFPLPLSPPPSLPSPPLPSGCGTIELFLVVQSRLQWLIYGYTKKCVVMCFKIKCI